MNRKYLKTNGLIGLLGLFFLFVSGQILGAVNAPDLKCVSVAQNGNATLTWISPADPNNEFQFYNVYVSTNVNGPYSVTVVNGLNTTQFTDVVNNANLNSVYFYVQTVYDDGSGQMPSVSSDTARSILPIFTAVTDSTCTVQWNSVFSPNIVTNSGIYRVYRKIGVSGVETLLGTTTYGNETYDDSFKAVSYTHLTLPTTPYV